MRLFKSDNQNFCVCCKIFFKTEKSNILILKKKKMKNWKKNVFLDFFDAKKHYTSAYNFCLRFCFASAQSVGEWTNS